MNSLSILVLILSIVPLNSKSVRQLNSFSKSCNGHVCDYVVQVSTSSGSNGTATVTFPRKFIAEMNELQMLMSNLAIVLKSDMLQASHALQGLRNNFTTLEHKMTQSINTAKTSVESNHKSLLHELKELRSDVDTLYGVVKGRTPGGEPIIANVVSLKSQVPIDFGTDCASLYKAGVNVSGIYSLQPDPSDNSTRFNAVCDMTTRGGGWTLIQRRYDGSDDFFRGWNDYRNGFGNFFHDFWLGLEKMHILTKHGNNRMRIDLMDWEANYRFAEFDYVTINDEKDKYRILAGGYSGTAGDPFHTQYYQQRMQSMQFSTFDNDNDFDQGGNCAKNYNSGWWFSNCFIVNLNGVWYPTSKYYGSTCNGIVWDMWSNHTNCYSLKNAEIRFRPETF